MLKSLTRFISKTILFTLLGLIILYTGMFIFRDEIRQSKIDDFKAISIGIHDYEVEGVRFRVPGPYLSHYFRFKPGKARVLRLEASMPDLRPRPAINNSRFDVADPDRITFQVAKKLRSGPMVEFVPVSYDKETRLITPEGWVRYEDDVGFYLYYKGLQTPEASKMRCSFAERVINPGCHVTYYLSEKLEVNITFLLSRVHDWVDVENKVRTKLNEFINDGERDD
ncbi:MAG: hypothetical protein P8H03_05065 [Emcibacteraceae bacterium]|nr:hypothetical protein [Emcibacteraceae bacterium]